LSQIELRSFEVEQARDPAVSARRAAVVEAVQRLFPRAN
jgi:hypothetical protein